MILTDISKFIDKEIKARANNSVISATVVVVDELSDIMPVDTSLDMFNWQIPINESITTANNAFYMDSEWVTKNLSKRAVVNSTPSTFKERVLGSTIYTQNNIQYIKKLDERNLTQFSGEFIPKTLIIFRNELRGLYVE
jgi:hypothetical protein